MREWNEDRFGVAYDRPLARLRELTVLVHQMVTAAEQAEIGRFEGEFYSVDLRRHRLPRPVRPSIPIWLAPLRSPMIELSAEVADGLLGHPVWSPRWITGEVQADPAPARPERARACDPGRVQVVAFLRVAISDDVGEGRRRTPRRASRCTPRSRSTTRTSPPTGFADEARALQRLAASGAPYRDLAAAVTDEMARELVIVGTPDEAAARSPISCPTWSTSCASRPRRRSRPTDPGVRGRHRPAPAPRRLIRVPAAGHPRSRYSDGPQTLGSGGGAAGVAGPGVLVAADLDVDEAGGHASRDSASVAGSTGL